MIIALFYHTHPWRFLGLWISRLQQAVRYIASIVEFALGLVVRIAHQIN